jgi:hypothetical protein
MEISEYLVFIDCYAILAEILPFKGNNFPVFSLLKTEMEIGRTVSTPQAVSQG